MRQSCPSACHEVILEEQMFTSIHSKPQHCMEMNALFPGNEPMVPTEYQAGSVLRTTMDI